MSTAMHEFEQWESFYVIVGAAAGALIGLQFVVMTLIAEGPMQRASGAGAAFATPTIVHFSMAFLLSALVRVPWPGIALAALAWGLTGIGGIVYTAIVVRRMKSQTAYRPVFEDWLVHGILPLAAYAALVIAAFAAEIIEPVSLFTVAGVTLALLFIGIHNAWDAVSYHVFVVMPRSRGAPHQDDER